MAKKKSEKETRSIDDNGRLVIPMEMRARAGMIENRDVEFELVGQSIVVRSYIPGCLFCGSSEEHVNFSGRKICRKCLSEIKELK